MILVYFVANVDGYSCRSVKISFGYSYKHQVLHPNLPHKPRALGFARNWVKHTGQKIDDACIVIEGSCFLAEPTALLNARLMLHAMLYGEPYKDDAVRGHYETYREVIGALADTPTMDAVEALNMKGRNIFMEESLAAASAHLQRELKKAQTKNLWQGK